MIACAQIQEALINALQDDEPRVEIEATRQLIRVKIITREVKERLKRLLRSVYVESGLSIIQETGYVTEEILDALYSVAQKENCSDSARRTIANIINATAKNLAPSVRGKWIKTLMNMFHPSESEETQESIVRAVAAFQCSETDVAKFFLDVIDNSRFEGVSIQAAVGLSRLGYDRLTLPYLMQVSRSGESIYCFDALEGIITSTKHADVAFSVLEEMLKDYQGYAWCMSRVMGCVRSLGKEKAQLLVPLMIGILRLEEDPPIVEPIIDVLVWLGNDSEEVINRLTEWLNIAYWSSLPTVALVYLIRLGKITEQSLDRFPTGNKIWWDLLVRDWQKNPEITIPDAVRNRLISLSHSCQQSPLVLLARVYLGGFSQEDFDWTVEILNSSGNVGIKEPLLGVLAELWIKQGCKWVGR